MILGGVYYAKKWADPVAASEMVDTLKNWAFKTIRRIHRFAMGCIKCYCCRKNKSGWNKDGGDELSVTRSNMPSAESSQMSETSLNSRDDSDWSHHSGHSDDDEHHEHGDGHSHEHGKRRRKRRDGYVLGHYDDMELIVELRDEDNDDLFEEWYCFFFLIFFLFEFFLFHMP